MKKLFAKFGAVVMLAVMLTAISGADSKARSKTLVLRIDFSNEIFNKPGSTSKLHKGVRTYQEYPLLHAVGGPVVGLYRFHVVSTLPKKVDRPGWYGNESFHIFGHGVIEGISAVDRSVSDEPVVGSIIGGTGRYAGASGEYISDDLVTYTFTFEKAH